MVEQTVEYWAVQKAAEKVGLWVESLGHSGAVLMDTLKAGQTVERWVEFAELALQWVA